MKAFYLRNKDRFNRFESTLLEAISDNCKPKLKDIKIAGEINEKDQKRVGIVGSRRMTPYGRQVIADVCKVLASQNITVVSGLMYGVDLEAQKQILKNRGRTIGVLGYGFDHLVLNSYAYEVAKTILHQKAGAIISEFEDAQTPQIWTFPKRNRIVAALSDYLIIVEAGKNSGTLITADLALEMGKEIFIIPGSIYNEQSYGCNKLLGEGASPLYDIQLLLGEGGEHKLQPLSLDKLTILGVEARRVYEYLLKAKNKLPVDKVEVMKNTLPSVNELNIALSELEFNALISVEGDILWLN